MISHSLPSTLLALDITTTTIICKNNFPQRMQQQARQNKGSEQQTS